MVMEQDARDATLVPRALVCEKEVALVPVKLVPVMVSVVVSELVGVSFCVIEPAAREKGRTRRFLMVDCSNPFFEPLRNA